jgi:tripartite-type tricarboxylate transporter receptor subunit TctC
MGGPLNCSRLDCAYLLLTTTGAGRRLRTVIRSALVLRVSAAAFAAVAVSMSGATAQQPGRSITFIVPFTPGTGPDILARVMGEEVQQRWGQPVIVENKAGASGNIGTQVVARSAADGHTLLLTTSPFTQNVSLFKSVPYDPVADFAPIIQLTEGFMALAVHPSVPATSAQGFIDYVKARPGQVDYASPGRGTPHHLSMELFKLATGTDVKHVAYRGSAPAVQDLVGGHISAMFIPVHVGLPLAKDSQIRLLGVAYKERVSVAPDIPTLPEQGIKGVDIDFWLGMLAPAGTPGETVNRYNTVLNDILRSPQIVEKLTAQGFVGVGGTSSDFGELIARDLAKWRKVVKEAGIAPE